MALEAVILDGSPRYKEWLEVFGANRVPVTTAVPRKTDLPGKPGAEFYLLDVAALTAEQRSRLVVHLSCKFNLPAEEVEASLDEHGLPILAEDVYVPIDYRYLI